MIKNILKLLIRMKRKYMYRKNDIYISPGSYVGNDVNIGKGTRINHTSHIGDCDIGAFCAIGGRLVIRSTDHFTCYLNMQDCLQSKIAPEFKVAGKSKGRVTIGNGVWIGDSVIILPGVRIGNGSVIGAGSVVTKSIPPYAVAVGNPARVIKYRFSNEKIKIVENIKWWEWSYDDMEKSPLFTENINEMDVATLGEIYDCYNKKNNQEDSF